MKLIDFTIQQNILAYKIIQSYIMNPSLANVTIHQESGVKSYTSEISKQVILDSTGGRKVIHDNFTLNPKSFKLKGFIKPFPNEVTFYFQPSLRTQMQLLEQAMETRDVVDFKDKNGKSFKVGIEKIEIEERADCQNAIPVSFDLLEVTKQEASEAILEKKETSGTPDKASENGEGKSLGTKTSTKKQSLAVAGYEMFFGD